MNEDKLLNKKDVIKKGFEFLSKDPVLRYLISQLVIKLMLKKDSTQIMQLPFAI